MRAHCADVSQVLGRLQPETVLDSDVTRQALAEGGRMAATNLREAGVPPEPGEEAGPVRLDFQDLYAAHFHSITVQLTAYTGSLTEAQDIVQEAFVRAWQRWSAISRYADPSAWVRRVAWNLAKSRWRRQRTFAAILRRHREEHVDGPGPDRVAL